MTGRRREGANPRGRTTAVIALLAIAGCLAYANALSNPFVLDDQFAVVENPQIRQLLPLSMPLSPPDETAVAKRPLVNLTFAMNYAVDGLEVRGYHAVNLLVFVAAAAVLFGLVRRTLGLGGRRGIPSGDPAWLAAGAALLWLLHPVNSEIVNYVSQRSEALMALCYLLTLYCAVRWAEQRRPLWHAAAVLACAAGMACKESMVTAPVLVVLFDRVFLFESFRAAFAARRWLYGGLASTWLLLAVLMQSGTRSTVGFDAGVGWWVYLLNQAEILATYFRLAVWPVGLVVDYGVPRSVELGDVAGAAALVVAAMLVALVALVRWPRAGFLLAAVFILLAPTSSVVPIASEVGAERRMFLPLASLAILLVCGIDRAFASLRGPERVRRGAVAGLSIAVAGALLAATWTRNREYGTTLALAQATVERRPHGRALYWLGVERMRAGQRAEGFRQLHRSATDYAPARFALGTELLVDGDLPAGILQLRLFAEAMPERGEATAARLQIARALMARGEHDAAATELQALLSRAPAHRAALAMLGEARLRQGRAAEAVQYLQDAVARGARDPVVHDLLGMALAGVGRVDQAIEQFRLALALDPSFRLARAHLDEAESRVSPASAPSHP